MDERTLQRKFYLFTVLFGLVSLLILFGAAYASHLINGMFRSAMDDQLWERLQQNRINITRKIEGDLQTLRTMGSFLEYNDDADVADFLSSQYQSSGDVAFVRIAFYHRNGLGVRVDYTGAVNERAQTTILPYQMRQMVEQAWSGEDALSEVYYDADLATHLVAYAIPVHQEGEVVGALCASQYASHYSMIIDSTNSVGERGVAAVMSQSGVFFMGIGYPLKNGLTTVDSLDFLTPTAQEELLYLLSGSNRGSFQFLGNDGLRYRGVVAPLGVYNYQLLMLEPEDDINPLLSSSIVLTRTVAIAIAFVAVGLMYMGYRQFLKSNRQLMQLAYYDPLTGAYNMEKFEQLLRQVLTEKEPVSVAGFNVRQFKFINEIFGTQEANQLLLYIKQALEDSLQPGEFFCRQSADAFFLLMRSRNREELSTRIHGILSSLRQMTEHRHAGYPITLYCGVASTRSCGRQDGDSAAQLLNRVMFALTRAKRGQMDSLQFYDHDAHKSEQLRNYIESHMQQALEQGEFRLYLQPKMDLERNQLSGAEALVRWITHEGKTIYPDQFIPLFEENGFCIQLDLYMVEQVCKQLREWMDQGLTPVPISVNQTKLLFYEKDYVERLNAITSRYQIPSHLITLEILEGMALGNIQELNQCIDRLKAQGFRISMDDFGSGYSSLNTLGRLNIDELKLDRAFLMAAAEHDQDQRQYLIMEQIIALAKKMHVSTVAEGVETQSDEEMIGSMGCDCGQGYLYSRPIPAQEFYDQFLLPHQQHI